METIGHALDPLCMFLYCWTGVWTEVPPLLDSFLGTLLLSLLCVIIGEFTSSVAFMVNRKYLKGLQGEVVQIHLETLQAKDEVSYKFLNRKANDAYGKLFCSTTIFSAASLLPAFFALGWIQYRFSGVELPLPIFGKSVGYTFVFILCYILNRIFFKNIKGRIPYFRHVQSILDGAVSSK